MFKSITFKESKFTKSLIFIIFCIRNLCGQHVKRSFACCAIAVFTAKIVLVIQPILLGVIVDQFSKASSKTHLLALLAVFSFLGLVAALMASIKNYYILLLREQLGKDLSIELLRKLQQFSHDFFHSNNVCKISQINNLGLEALHGFMVAFLSEIIPFFFELSLISIIIIAKLNLITSMPLFVVFILYSYISIAYSSKERASISHLSDAKINISSQFYENVINFDSIKMTHAENSRLQTFAKYAEDYLSLAKTYGKLFFDKSLLQNIILYLGQFAILSISIIGFLHKQLSAGEFVMLNAYFFQITSPIVNVLRSYEVFNKSITDIDPLKQLVLRKPDLEVHEPKAQITEPHINININHINFSYDKEASLSDINFAIPAGHKIALVGPTGSGKSTIAKLLMRFYDPDTGTITINNHNVQNISFPQLRTIIGFVPQDITLLHDTIFKNITMGRNDLTIDDILAITKSSALLDYVYELKEGFNTIVGDRGLKLSGGQKQRIGIARALIRKPKLLILDEYNSALDPSIEQRINNYINPQTLQCSILLIAHRLSSIIDADEIIVIQNGKITQRGKHTNLLKEDGWYQAAWDSFSRSQFNVTATSF